MQAIEVYWSSLRGFEGGGGKEENSACENAKGRSARTSLNRFPAVFLAPFGTPGSTIKVVTNAALALLLRCEMFRPS